MINSINDLMPGAIINNEKLSKIFSCSTQGGMRRSLKTNSLVIVSNHIKSIYDDRWLDHVFYYTGMGTKGDQRLEFAQNQTLANSNFNGVRVYLFEVFVEKEYSYVGQVELIDPPYFENQPDEDGLIRKACVFPLKIIDGNTPTINKDYADKAFEQKSKIAKRLSDEEIKRRANNAKKKTGVRNVMIQQYDRDPWIAEHAKRLATGLCQLCEKPAPFKSKDGTPYLETHHIIWLARGGEDTVENTVALCPNCHRRMHIIDDNQDIKTLLDKKIL